MNISKANLFKRRSESKVCLAFAGLNRYELDMLISLRGLLEITGREIISKRVFFETLSNNHKYKRKIDGFYYGLLRKRYCNSFEYVQVPGSECLGISALGYSALAMFDRQIDEMIGGNVQKLKPKTTMRRKYIQRVIPDAITA